jgi:hypothetical protein
MFLFLVQWFSNISGLWTPWQYFTHSSTPYPFNMYILVCISTSNTDLKQIFYLKFYTVLTLQNICFPVALNFLTWKFNDKNYVFSVMTPAAICPVELLKSLISCHLRLQACSSSLTSDPLWHFTCFFIGRKQNNKIIARAPWPSLADHHLINTVPDDYIFQGNINPLLSPKTLADTIFYLASHNHRFINTAAVFNIKHSCFEFICRTL